MTEENLERGSAGVIHGQAPHYIDHLVPLCHVLRIPLFVSDVEIAETVREWYPETEVRLFSPFSFGKEILEYADTLFVCTPQILLRELFFFLPPEQAKSIRSVWCPHGNSDKGHAISHMEGLQQEEILLVYGQKMLDFLEERKVSLSNKLVIRTGNFRYVHYLENRKRYDLQVERFLAKRFREKKPTLLYAPTWQDGERSSSFFTITEYLIRNLPEKYNLIIKPHPNLRFQNEIRYEMLKDLAEGRSDILFLSDCPLIYPLLAACSVYIGDFSSIGYDFLTFRKPMLFLNQGGRSRSNPGTYLHRCGTRIETTDFFHLYSILENALPSDFDRFDVERQRVYRYTFGEEISPEQLRKTIIQSLIRSQG